MKKKKNEYKPHRYKNLPKNILSVLGTLVLAYVFAVVGYSVAKPFGEIGEPEAVGSDIVSDSDPSASEPSDKKENSVKAYWLKENEFTSLEDITNVVRLIRKSEYNMVVVPLKVKGGRLNYNSAYEGAVMADIGNDLDLSSICSAIIESGFEPAASINAMEDNLYPNYNTDSGFVLKSNKNLWLDKQNSEGKPWLNPASNETKKYLSAITGEITKAGFKKIICTNMKYPPLSKEALEDIGGRAIQTDRYLELIDSVNDMAAMAEEKGGSLWLEISAYEVLTDSCEVFYKPIMLNSQKYVLQIDTDLFKENIKIHGKEVDFKSLSLTEKIEKICKEMEKNIYKTSFIPEIVTDKLSQQQKTEIEDTFKKLGYKTYIIR